MEISDGSELFVDFSSCDDTMTIKNSTNDETVKKFEIKYDHETREKYRVYRLRKMDPIMYMEIPEELAFKFKYKWDPYTGERQEEDTYGPLYFDPDFLIKYFYTKRLDKLWVNPIDEHNNGYYQGYYDSGVGAGEDFYLIGRGHHPEWYVFRLPIIDCYLTENHNKQLITFGPRLTDEEITEIERLANLRPGNYKNLFQRDRPSLTKIKKFYDIAIAQRPSIENIKIIDPNELQNHYNMKNREAVDILLNMRG
jgi:hypothetical protein